MPDVDQRLRDRVRQIIAKSSLTDGDFAAEIGLDGPKLSKSLSGVRRFTPMELALIAELGDVGMDWLLNGEQPKVAMLAARAEDSRAVAAAKDRAAVFGDVFELLARVGVNANSPSLDLPPLSGTQIAQGSRLAEWARRCILGHPDMPPDQRDLEGICEAVFGADIAVDDFGSGFDGLAWTQGKLRLVLINNRSSWTRQRFTIAHELAHILCMDSQDLQIDVDVMDRYSRRSVSEMRANAFAAAFLMPEDRIKEVAGEESVTREAFAKLLGEFGVSASSFAWRLFNLTLIDDQTREEFSRLGLSRAARIADWEDELDYWSMKYGRSRPPGNLQRYAQSAYTDGLIGARPLAAVLGLPADALLDLPVARPGVESGTDEPVFSP